jgi:VWFA-related protein
VPAFRLDVPRGMVTGRVALRARTDDPRVARVIWTVGGVTRRAVPSLFDAEFEVGPVPEERPILAIAMGGDGQALFEQQDVLNPGESAVGIEILSPLQGEKISGRVPVVVRARVPGDDSIASLTLDSGGGPVVLPRKGEVRTTAVVIPDRTTPLTASVVTASGRTAGTTIVLNGRGVLSSSGAHVVEQMVGVHRGKEPLEGLTAADFTVRDAEGACEIREVRLLRDTPLAVGLLVDTSESLMFRDALRQATAHLFIETTLDRRDRAFLVRFGPAVVRVVGWTRSKQALREAVLALENDPMAGTLLHTALVRALYQFQGSQGARVLVLITDGNAFDDEVPESAAIAYTRQSGVKIYALALPWTELRLEGTRRKDAEGKTTGTVREIPVERPPNLDALERITDATGGRTFRVRGTGDLPRFFTQIERDIRTQYLVSYVPNVKRTGSFHAVEIRTRRGRVQAPPGFFY